MKIDGSNSGSPVDLQKVKEQKNLKVESSDSKKASESHRDVVDTKLSDTIGSIADGISKSGLSPADVHSHIDPNRAKALLESFDRVGESKQPQVDHKQLLKIADKLSNMMLESPQQATSAFGPVSRSRVEELLA